MQTALAVNTALMALMKAGVMCTEPYRVPSAGKIDAILFDKTVCLASHAPHTPRSRVCRLESTCVSSRDHV